ncbi:alpha/beta hydrolase family esterase [Nocardia sp. NPDC059240]|uniref:alpha/beta hydrolase family esterase n=1 Tax=Nocardia sp. NPDC059240 TaxID=3346786 RepID=UPI0036A4FF3D
MGKAVRQGCPLLVRVTAATIFVIMMAIGATVRASADGVTAEADFGNSAGTRHYFVYSPPGDTAGLPLVLWLHGCTDIEGDEPNIRENMGASMFGRLARELGFVFVEPIQPMAANPLGCWNSFDPANQHRDAGEPSILAGITRTVLAGMHLDKRRVYVAGHSGGGLMATVLGAAYPDLFAALDVLCTGAYRGGTDLTGTAAFAEMGPRARPLPVFMVEDSEDPFSSVPIGRMALNQWLGTDELALGASDPRPPAPLSVQHTDPGAGFIHPGTLETYGVGPVQVRILTLDGGDHNLVDDAEGALRQSISFAMEYRLP